MGDQYAGDDVDVYFNTVDISATARVVTVSEEAPAPPDINATHKGDTAQVLLEGIPGGVVTSVTVEALADLDGQGIEDSTIFDFALNTKDTLFIYPAGREHTREELIIQNARYHALTETIPYDDVVGWTASFQAKNTVTRQTYSTAA